MSKKDLFGDDLDKIGKNFGINPNKKNNSKGFLKDIDNDDVPNSKDCDSLNPNRQDNGPLDFIKKRGSEVKSSVSRKLKGDMQKAMEKSGYSQYYGAFANNRNLPSANVRRKKLRKAVSIYAEGNNISRNVAALKITKDMEGNLQHWKRHAASENNPGHESFESDIEWLRGRANRG